MGTTRKQKQEAMSIPELRRAIHHITSVGAGLSSSKDKQAVATFQREWQKTFGKPLSEKVARDYLAHVRSLGKTKKKQRGGMAPIAYRMEPGGTTPYGNFPAYVSKGFFVPMSDNIANCGKLDATVVPQAGLGSNDVGLQKASEGSLVGMPKAGLAALRGGGRRKRTSKGRRKSRKTQRKATRRRRGGGLFESIKTSLEAVGQRAFVATNPVWPQHNLMMNWKGQDSVPGRLQKDNTYDTTYALRRPDPSLPRLPVPNAPTITGAKVVQLPRL